MDTEINDENITDISNNITLATIQTSNIYSDINSNEFNNLNSITIEYFSNTGFYNKYLNKSEIEKYISKSDKKFYKKRIINETKKMLKDEFETDTLREIFNKYIFSLINHFKIIDRNEILQKQFNNLSGSVTETEFHIDFSNNKINSDISNNLNKLHSCIPPILYS